MKYILSLLSAALVLTSCASKSTKVVVATDVSANLGFAIEEKQIASLSPINNLLANGTDAGMVEIDGNYCPNVEEVCLKWLDTDISPSANGGIGPLRCAEFKYPTKCLSKKKTHLHFYIDKLEWPNKQGSLPEVGFNWYGAKQRCESVGKHLCEENQWQLACESEETDPYSYGYSRDASICNVDKPWIDYTKYQQKDWNLLYQAVPSDINSPCKSKYGVVNMNGNVDEIINNPTGKPYKNESVGGYWGPVRARCRPTTKVHSESFLFYQLGTRCCK